MLCQGRGCRPSEGRRIGQAAIRPEHSADDFVADLNHIGHRTGVAKRADRILGVLFDGRDQFVVRHALPRARDELLLRIGPGVGVMKVEKELKAELLGLFCLCDRVFEIVRQAIRRVEQSQADPVVAVVLEDFEARFWLAVVFEHSAQFFGVREERHVGADCELFGETVGERAGEKQNRAGGERPKSATRRGMKSSQGVVTRACWHVGATLSADYDLYSRLA
jgi:hypothetical protein